jgi:hypothetical protein
MKKLFSISLLFSVAAMMFTGCVSEEDDLFDSSAAERLMTSKKMYTDRLGGSTWVMEFYPLNTDEAPKGQGYLILNKFNRDGSVVQAMQNELTDGQYLTDTSLWEVISDQGTVLTFNTFNKCIHMFSDPGLYQTGQGFEGDYEFVILSLEEGAKYGMLKGKKRATYNRLTRLPDDVNFEEYLKVVNDFIATMFSQDAPNEPLICFGDKRYVITNTESCIFDFYPEGGDEISQTESHAFMVTKRDGDYYLRFRESVKPDSVVDENNAIQELKYDKVSDRFVDETDPNKWIASRYTVEEFFKNEFEDNHAFRVYRDATVTELSAKMLNALNAAHEDIKAINKNYAINQISLKYDAENGARWFFKYQSGNAAKNIEYLYSCNFDGNKVNFKFLNPATSNAEAIMNRVAGINSLLTQTLSQEFVITPYVTTFNYKKVMFTSVTDPELWFVVNY